MEHAFHRYVNLRVVYGYTFEQAVTLYLEDDQFTELEKQAFWVNTARNRIILERQNATLQNPTMNRPLDYSSNSASE